VGKGGEEKGNRKKDDEGGWVEILDLKTIKVGLEGETKKQRLRTSKTIFKKQEPPEEPDSRQEGKSGPGWNGKEERGATSYVLNYKKSVETFISKKGGGYKP